ncbi:MAG: CDP-diacylglycerol--glycerol-3-phosphate 3-phosphatidyltransferase [Gammaproteobacteria bacterium]|nr:CDP-diacylglycerol--glycerol-3-phosphate 3-phosphatidyltransferase [Gammaproteobacteria bacterium]
MNIPNILTLSRIVMIPVFVIIFYLPFSWHYLAACVIFILAAITDGLDGYYARKLGQTSALGAFLDPVADKLMIAVVLVLLVEDQPSIWLALPAAVIIGREITISALREWMAELGASSKVAVSGYGKLKTICQMVALGFLIYHNDLFGIPIYNIGMVLLYIASILTLWSMFLYLQAAWPQLKDS